MSCEGFDWKAYTLGDLAGAEGKRHEEHLKGCEACQAEASGLKLTVTALKRLPKMEPPRRIAFVSDPVVEPGWWARLWASGPRLGFASAAMLSVAILAHGMMARTPGTDPGQFQARVEQEVAKRLPEAVDEAVAARYAPALADMKRRLDGLEQGGLVKAKAELDEQRKADMQEIRAAFELMERRMNTRYLSAARFGGD